MRISKVSPRKSLRGERIKVGSCAGSWFHWRNSRWGFASDYVSGELNSLEVVKINNVVENLGPKKLWKFGIGKVIIESGAAESVMPWQMLPSEKLMPSLKSGARYIDASGHEMSNKG